MLRFLLNLLICTASLFTNPAVALTKKTIENPIKLSLLEQISDEFNQIALAATPATVFIKVLVQNPPPFNLREDEFFRRFFGESHPFSQQPLPPVQGGGSGFIVRSDGYIVTNNHVVKNATKITVLLSDGREFPATVKGTDPRTDLAVVKIDETNLPVLTFGDSDKLNVGEFVVAIGNPFGLEASLSVGVVSAKGRQDLGLASFEDFIQTDAVINLGNSGGPLLNPRGEVVGVNTAILSCHGGYIGIGLSIPSKMAQNVIDQIILKGIVRRAYLGIIMQPVDKDFAEALGIDKQDGLLISEVVNDSPAEKAGLLQGDILIAYNDKPIKSITKFRNDIALMSPLTEISIKLLRNNTPLTIKVQLGSLSDIEVATSELAQKIGIEIENLTPELAKKLGCVETEGVVITNIQQDSPAAAIGLQKGFVITHIAFNNLNNQIKISNITDFDQAMKQMGDNKLIILIARHQNYQRYYTIRLK